MCSVANESKEVAAGPAWTQAHANDEGRSSALAVSHKSEPPVHIFPHDYASAPKINPN
jgi:hypothetical protein